MFRSVVGSNENTTICFRNLLTFKKCLVKPPQVGENGESGTNLIAVHLLSQIEKLRIFEMQKQTF